MSRRDTILVAVLINVGLLTVLFATAVNREPQTMIEPLPLAEAQAIRSESVIQTAAALPPSRDEGDQALRTFREQRKQKMLNTPVVAAPKTTAPKPSAVPVLEEYADDGMVEVTVKRGDVLERIARANDTTVKAIQEANNLTSTMLRVGQVLRVPVGKKEEAKATAFAPVDDKPDDAEYYIVQMGDNPWSIARKQDITLEHLKALNDLDEDKARRLRPGDKLRIR